MSEARLDLLAWPASRLGASQPQPPWSDAPFLVRPVAKVIASTVSRQFIDPSLENHVGFLADHLAKHAWFAGDEISAADVQMCFSIEGLIARGGANAPKLTEWLTKVHARPAFQKAIERGGSYKILS